MRDDERRKTRGTWDATISAVAPARGVVGETTQILVAHIEIKLGHIVGPGSFRWQEWPEAALNHNHITRDKRPSAAIELTGSVARETMQPGDPVYSRNLTARSGPTP
jgi:pilus assembly protein CpaB